MQEINQRTGEIAIAAVLFTIGLVWFIVSLQMPRGEFAVPGPGFFPMFLSLALCVSALVLVGVALLGGTTVLQVRVGNRSIWATALALLLLAVLFEPLGFIPAIALFVGFFLRLLAGFRWLTCLVAGLAAAYAVHLFFGGLLGLPLPPVRWL